MNRHLKIILILLGLILALIVYLNYETYYSRAGRRGKINLENIVKIKEGMKDREVLLIMGNPDTIISSFDNEYFPFSQYLYKTNDQSNAHVRVIFDSTMTVIKTYSPENR